MNGMALVEADVRNHLLAVLFSVVLLTSAVIALLVRRFRRVAVIPLLGLFPLFHSCRVNSERITLTPAFVDNCTTSQIDLTTLAKQVKAGGHPAVPMQVGRFQIVRYEVLPTGAVVLITHEDLNWHSKMWGFVWYPDQPFSEDWASAVGFQGEAGSENRVKRILSGWYVLYNHYIFIKRGWS